MRAIVCKTWGGPETLALEELPSPRAGAGEVVIDVKAAGVNFPDVLIIQNKYQIKPALPFTPGAELAGIVKEAGAGVEHVKPGDAVVGYVTTGAFAEECSAPASKVMRIPPGVDFGSAAAFSLTYGTVWHALKDRGSLQPKETLLVLGAGGGVGIAAVDIGTALGARVIAAASNDEKLAICRARGAEETINYTRDDLRARLREIAGERGIDVIFDPVGGQYSEPALRSIAWRGRFLVIGFANGEIPKIPLNLVLLKGAAIVGVYWGGWLQREPEASERETQMLFDWLKEGRLKPLVSARFPLAQTADALRAMAARKVTGKAIIEPEA
jgi:NADPH2:quinone reductase